MHIPLLVGRKWPLHIETQVYRRQPPLGFSNDPDTSQTNTDTTSNSNNTTTIVAATTFTSILLGGLLIYLLLRRLRRQNRSPRYLPGSFLKSKWHQWQPVKAYKSVNGTLPGASSTSMDTSYNPAEERAAASAAAAGVDRNTSVRSVMTLPAYSQTPKETEQVIGREGERANMDTVVEFPETVEEEETARENEMSSLYQIRNARRIEIAEREERRRERREARARGDWQRLDELRQESRARATSRGTNDLSTGNMTADMLIAEHQSRSQERRVSSVAYGDVGQVRHDGTRLRANSAESERGGLLEGAAPMGHERTGSDVASMFTLGNMSAQDIGEHGRSGSDATSLFSMNNLSRPNLPFAGRHRSDSGALSISTTSSFNTSIYNQVTSGTPQADPATQGSNATTSSSSQAAVRHTPQGSSSSDDIGDTQMTSIATESNNRVSLPPQYDIHDWGDAPAYEEQMRRAESMRILDARQSGSGAPRLPMLNVPSINIEIASEPSTPVSARESIEQSHR